MNKLLRDKKVINIINETNDLNYNLKDNEQLIVNIYNEDLNSFNINIHQNNNSYVVINFSTINKKDCDININGLITGDNNHTIINTHVISENNHANFNVCVKANENTKDNEIIENLKGINENGTITFMPILEVDTSEVKAEHYATIGSFSKEELFYLESKKISTDTAKIMLKNSFIFNLFSDDFISLVKKGSDIYE